MQSRPSVGLCLIGLALVAFSEILLSQTASVQMQTSGGTLTFALNPGALKPLGMVLDTSGFTTARFTAAREGHYAMLVTHIAQTSGLNVERQGQHIEVISSGLIELHDGPRFLIPQGEVDLRLARVKVLNPPSFALALTDRDGKLWGSLDHPHYGLSADGHEFWMRDLDLHIGPALASALGNAAFTGDVIGSVSLSLPVSGETVPIPSLSKQTQTCTTTWPSSSRRADLKMILLDHDPELGGLSDSITVMRCGIPNGSGYEPCTATSNNGLVVMAPDAAVENVGTTAIPWHAMFSDPTAPYGNDQHPYLIWNLYRIDGNGAFRQIGHSGVKHAYYADNFSCTCSPQLASYPGCRETYAAGTNDVANTLGPRSEVIPATGQWGRCGSIFDPTCVGQIETRHFADDDGYRNRLVVSERNLLPEHNPKAKYLFEYGYLVRDERDPESAIASRWVTPSKTPTTNGIRWSMTPTNFSLGPALNAWVDPARPAQGEMSARESTVEGHFRVSVRTTKLTGSRYRYSYAVLNEDFARAITSGNEPNLRIEASGGFDQFQIRLGTDVRPEEVTFTDSDDDARNDWANSIGDRAVNWHAPSGNSLTWGNVYTFALVARSKPEIGRIMLHVVQPGKPAWYETNILVPAQASQKLH